jgi:hypothetical protein
VTTSRSPGDRTAEGDAPLANADRWLLLVYRVPSEPTRLRATVWRRLKGLGAIYLQNAAAALPATAASERALRILRQDIVDMGGTAVLSLCDVLAGAPDVIDAYRAARDEEYEEIIDKCQDFQAGIEKEYAGEHFTYAELEENDVDLVKLQQWFAKVRERDVLGASGRAAAESALAACAKALEGYAARVYAEEPDGH